MIRGSNNLRFNLFPDPIGHFGLSGRLGVAGGEREPQAPLGWYCHQYQPYYAIYNNYLMSSTTTVLCHLRQITHAVYDNYYTIYNSKFMQSTIIILCHLQKLSYDIYDNYLIASDILCYPRQLSYIIKNSCFMSSTTTILWHLQQLSCVINNYASCSQDECNLFNVFWIIFCLAWLCPYQ